MWIASKYGFFSIAAAHAMVGDENFPPAPHGDLVMIRARDKAHLEALQKDVPRLDGEEIWESIGTDYPFRILVTRDQLADVMEALMDIIDYTNFKYAVEVMLGPDRPFIRFLHRVWQLGLGLTPTTVRGKLGWEASVFYDDQH